MVWCLSIPLQEGDQLGTEAGSPFRRLLERSEPLLKVALGLAPVKTSHGQIQVCIAIQTLVADELGRPKVPAAIVVLVRVPRAELRQAVGQRGIPADFVCEAPDCFGYRGGSRCESRKVWKTHPLYLSEKCLGNTRIELLKGWLPGPHRSKMLSSESGHTSRESIQ